MNDSLKSVVENLVSSEVTSERAKEILDEELSGKIELQENIVCDKYRLHTSVHEYRALCEHPPNTVDSIIENNYDGGKSFDTCREACEDLLDAEAIITMRLGGEKGGETSITFSDNAYGQPVEKFDRFLTLGDKGGYKREHSFLHGCRGKGHLTTLQHTNYKVIATSTIDSNQWAFTVMYQRDDGEYVYITDGDEYITVSGEVNFGAEIGTKEHGTVLKHIGYDISYDGSNQRGFRKLVRKFSHGTVEPFAPVRITDARNRDYLYLYKGILQNIKEKERVFECIESTMAKTNHLGDLKITCAVPKNSLPSSQAKKTLRRITTSSENTVFLTVDGQTHFRMSNSFLDSRLNMDEIGSDTVVVAQVVEPANGLEDIFDDDRQSFRKSEYLKEFKQTLVDAVGGMDELKQANVDRMVESLEEMKSSKSQSREKKSDKSKKAKDRRLSELEEDVSLLSLFENPEELGETHKRGIKTISGYKNAPIVQKMMNEYEDKPVLQNITEILNKAEVYTNRRSIRQGKNVEQAGKNAIGKMFEMFVYLEIVKACQDSDYVCYYQPHPDELPGLEQKKDTQTPDIDIAVCNPQDKGGPAYIMSLKTSLKDRIKQSAYWRLKMKLPSTEEQSDGLDPELVETSPFRRKNRSIQYGYVSPIWSGGSSGSMLREFDFGYVVDENTDDDINNQFELSSLKSKVENQRNLSD